MKYYTQNKKNVVQRSTSAGFKVRTCFSFTIQTYCYLELLELMKSYRILVVMKCPVTQMAIPSNVRQTMVYQETVI